VLVSSLMYDVIAKILELHQRYTKIKDIEHHDFYAQRKIPNMEHYQRQKLEAQRCGKGGWRDMNAGECGTGVNAEFNGASNGIRAFDFSSHSEYILINSIHKILPIRKLLGPHS